MGDHYNIGVSMYVTACSSCGVTFGITEAFEARKRADGSTFYCPNGHGQVFRKTDAQREREKREIVERQNSDLAARVLQLSKDLRKAKAAPRKAQAMAKRQRP